MRARSVFPYGNAQRRVALKWCPHTHVDASTEGRAQTVLFLVLHADLRKCARALLTVSALKLRDPARHTHSLHSASKNDEIPCAQSGDVYAIRMARSSRWAAAILPSHAHPETC